MLRLPNPKSDIWILTINYHPNCPEGVRPCPVGMLFGTDSQQAEHPEWYHPKEFMFDRRPSRTDFESMVNMLPYMQGNKILSIIKANPWCIVPDTNKSHSQNLKDENGKMVGSLTVSRSTMYCASGYQPIGIPCKLVDKAINRRNKSDAERNAAQMKWDECENQALEMLLEKVGATQREPTDKEYNAVIKEIMDGWKAGK